MNHKEKLLEIYDKSFDISDINNISEADIHNLEIITTNIARNKGVYTVLVTLMTHKLLDPEQDIRFFQKKMLNGFSARTIDTNYITPTLKELNLPSMAESGWLTRSLEQPYPYKLNYKGEISGKGMKAAFLYVISSFQKNPSLTENFLRFIINAAIILRESNIIEINKLENSEHLFISQISYLLEKHFNFNYKTHGGSKLPVLAFYAIYQILILELDRYKNCDLAPLGSHTASDRTSKTAGDIEILKNGKVFEAIEVKLDKRIDITMVRIAYEKIIRFNTERYYILSSSGIVDEERKKIKTFITEIKAKHGCELIVNDLLNTLRYYLRLISSPRKFFNNYIFLIEKDKELKKNHKNKLIELIKDINIPFGD